MDCAEMADQGRGESLPYRQLFTNKGQMWGEAFASLDVYWPWLER